MSEHPVELWACNNLYVDVTLKRDGALLIEGQHLRGGGEYEYALTVRPRDVPKVVEALGGAPGDDPLPLLVAKAEDIISQGEQTWLKSLGLDVKFWSRSD